MVETPCLDSEALSELREVMEDEFDILIQTYVEDSRHRIESLRQALDAGDPTALSRAAHSFKGSCFNIGVMLLGGFEPEQAYIVHFISIAIGHFNHSNIKISWGPLKYIFNNHFF